jgi:uncharacterized membrane protein YfcA
LSLHRDSSLRRVAHAGYVLLALGFFAYAIWGDPALAARESLSSQWPWWAWPILLFILTSVLGVLAALAGIGGSVLFVPIVSGFLPFLHIDFTRGAGLMVALTGALAAGPTLLRQDLAHLRLAIPVALIASFTSIFGAMAGLAMPPHVVQIFLGVVIIAIFFIMTRFSTEVPAPPARRDPIAALLGIRGEYRDVQRNRIITWEPQRMVLGMVCFAGVGLMAGMFGLGAGWANVPVLTIVMGVPLRIAVGTSYFLLAITDTSAAWIYLNRGAVIPLIAIPSVLGIMTGAQVGARLLVWLPPAIIRLIVLGVLLLAGTRALLRGLGI